MKLRTQIIGFGLVGALLGALTGGVGLAANHRLGAATEQAISAAEALQSSQLADMMHDAVRGDAQRAMLGALEGRTEQIDAARTDLVEHGKTFRDALARLGQMALADDSRNALAEVLPLIDRYLASADTLVRSAAAADGGMRAAVDALQVDFERLETSMAALSDSIQASNQRVNERAHADVVLSQRLTAAVLIIALAAAVLLSLRLARRLSMPMDHAAEVAHRLAEGDLTVPITASGNDEMQRLLVSLQEMRDHLADIVRQVKSNADDVAVASSEIARGNQDLSDRTEEQASALQQTAATMDQLATTVRHNADSAREADALATGAAGIAARGSEVMGRMTATMDGINDSSRRIASIIGVIDGIAFQTNILALNAAVEAARAGEQGRGFAVVAAEVRMLAQRSAAAAREVRALVDTSVERVSQGSTLVDNACNTMSEVASAIQRVTQMVASITTASAQQSTGVSQVGEAVSQMDQTTQQNAALVEQSAAAAESLSRQAQQLVQAVSAFRLGEAQTVGA
jgi:methyl-accepting chemotaxis protein